MTLSSKWRVLSQRKLLHNTRHAAHIAVVSALELVDFSVCLWLWKPMKNNCGTWWHLDIEMQWITKKGSSPQMISNYTCENINKQNWTCLCMAILRENLTIIANTGTEVLGWPYFLTEWKPENFNYGLNSIMCLNPGLGDWGSQFSIPSHVHTISDVPLEFSCYMRNRSHCANPCV